MTIDCASFNESSHQEQRLSGAVRAAEGSVLGLICFLSLFSNVSFWVTILRYRQLHSMVNFLLLSLSAADILETSITMTLTTHSVVVGKLSFSCTVCQLMGFITTLTLVASLTSLSALSLNRYIRICGNAWYHSVYNRAYIWLHILAIWTLSVVWASGPLLGWGKYGYTQNMFFCSLQIENPRISWIVGIATFTILILMTIYCYIATLHSLTEKGHGVTILASIAEADSAKAGLMPRSFNVSLQQTNTGWVIFNGQLVGKKLSTIDEITDSLITNEAVLSHTRSGRELMVIDGTNKRGSTASQLSRALLHFHSSTSRSFRKDSLRESSEDIPDRPFTIGHVSTSILQHSDAFSKTSSIEVDEKKKRQCHQRFVVAIICITVTFYVTLLPILNFTFLNHSAKAESAIKVTFLILSFSNKVLNPIMYGWGSSNIRRGYRYLFKSIVKSVQCKMDSVGPGS